LRERLISGVKVNRSFAIGEALSRLQDWQLLDLADFHRDQQGSYSLGQFQRHIERRTAVRTLGGLRVGWELDVKGSITVVAEIAAQRVTGNTLAAAPARSHVGEEVYQIAQQQNQQVERQTKSQGRS